MAANANDSLAMPVYCYICDVRRTSKIVNGVIVCSRCSGEAVEILNDDDDAPQDLEDDYADLVIRGIGGGGGPVRISGPFGSFFMPTLPNPNRRDNSVSRNATRQPISPSSPSISVSVSDAASDSASASDATSPRTAPTHTRRGRVAQRISTASRTASGAPQVIIVEREENDGVEEEAGEHIAVNEGEENGIDVADVADAADVANNEADNEVDGLIGNLTSILRTLIQDSMNVDRRPSSSGSSDSNGESPINVNSDSNSSGNHDNNVNNDDSSNPNSPGANVAEEALRRQQQQQQQQQQTASEFFSQIFSQFLQSPRRQASNNTRSRNAGRRREQSRIQRLAGGRAFIDGAYAFGDMQDIVNEVMRREEESGTQKYGAPPASDEFINNLERIVVTEELLETMLQKALEFDDEEEEEGQETQVSQVKDNNQTEGINVQSQTIAGVSAVSEISMVTSSTESIESAEPIESIEIITTKTMTKDTLETDIPSGTTQIIGIDETSPDRMTKKTVYECLICVEEYQIDEKIIILPCIPHQHIFHAECIESWLKQHNTCPVCRNTVEIVAKDENKKEENEETVELEAEVEAGFEANVEADVEDPGSASADEVIQDPNNTPHNESTSN